MVLKTKRLMLRPWQESDAESLFKYASSPKIGPSAGWPVHTSIENSLDVIRNVFSSSENYAVVLKESGCAVGSICIKIGKKSNIGLPDTEGELGFWLGVPYWGQGLIPEAVNEILRYAFEELNLKKIWCAYFDGNIQSKRVQEKCGFQYQYTLENVPYSQLNQLRTKHINCLTKEQWLERQNQPCLEKND